MTSWDRLHLQHQYISTFVDKKTEWKYIFFIKAKNDITGSLQLFNQSQVIPFDFRLIRLRGDRGAEFDSREFREY